LSDLQLSDLQLPREVPRRRPKDNQGPSMIPVGRHERWAIVDRSTKAGALNSGDRPAPGRPESARRTSLNEGQSARLRRSARLKRVVLDGIVRSTKAGAVSSGNVAGLVVP
jgi:hypothetical protein